MSRSRLRAADLDRSVRGTRRVGPAGFEQRCEQFALRMPVDAFFSHETAARLWGIPVPGPADATLAPVHIALPDPARAPHATGIRGHRLQIEPHELTTRFGLRVTTAARTWLDLAHLRLGDLVAAGDFVIHRRAPLATLGDLIGSLDRRRNPRGVRTLRRAIALLDDGSESPQESILRVLLVTSGLPHPQTNQDILDGRGRFVARGDLVFAHHRVVVEYQGDYHRDPVQWRADMTRRSRLEALGWRVVEVNADDLRRPAELVARLARILASRRAHSA